MKTAVLGLVFHRRDSDCIAAQAVVTQTGDCRVCGVSGSRDEAGNFTPPCASCMGERFHEGGCPDSGEAFALVAARVEVLGLAPEVKAVNGDRVIAHRCAAGPADSCCCATCGEKLVRRHADLVTFTPAPRGAGERIPPASGSRS